MGRPRAEYDPELEQARIRRRRASTVERGKKKPVFREIIAEFLDAPCVDCGKQYPSPAMQADHVQGKKYKISWFRGGCGTLKQLEQELAKCEVRCANCHVIRHASAT